MVVHAGTSLRGETTSKRYYLPCAVCAAVVRIRTYVQVYEPRVGDFDVRLFLSLTQADAYNPLIVGTSKFALPSEDVASEVSLHANRTAPW